MQRFVGVWALEPSTCDYADAPLQGVYTLLSEAGRVFVHVRWQDADGTFQQTAYTMPLAAVAEPMPEQPDLRARTDLRGDVLVSEVLHNGVVVHSAQRTIDGEGHMLVHQQVTTPDGVRELSATYVRSPVKQVICYRRDLKMRKGKIAAQCAHAAMAVFFRRDTGPMNELRVALDGPMSQWAKRGFAKIVLSVETEQDLLTIQAEAKRRLIPTYVITDAGKTEFKGVPTRTTVAIGPAANFEIDAITGRDGLVTTKLA